LQRGSSEASSQLRNAPEHCAHGRLAPGRARDPVAAGARLPRVEIHALVPALEPLDETAVDRDLWPILRWIIVGVGSP
jgi:hypothetical protein